MSMASERAEMMMIGIVERSRTARQMEAPFIVGSMRSRRRTSAPLAETNSYPSRPSAKAETV